MNVIIIIIIIIIIITITKYLCSSSLCGILDISQLLVGRKPLMQ
jgi:hypothetical protein